MKKLIFAILFLNSPLFADSISTGTIGFVLPSTNTVDPVKSWATKTNDNWQKADTALRSLGLSAAAPVIIAENGGVRQGDMNVLNLTGTGLASFSCVGTTCTATFSGGGGPGGGGGSSLFVVPGGISLSSITFSTSDFVFTYDGIGGGTLAFNRASTYTLTGAHTFFSSTTFNTLVTFTSAAYFMQYSSAAGAFISTTGFIGGSSTMTAITLKSGAATNSGGQIVGRNNNDVIVVINGFTLVTFGANTMTLGGQILGPGASAGVPDYAFGGNNTMGFYADHFAPSRIGLAVDSKPRLIIDGNGSVGLNGKYGGAGLWVSTSALANSPIARFSSGPAMMELWGDSTSIYNQLWVVGKSTFMGSIFTTSTIQMGGVDFGFYMSTVALAIAAGGSSGLTPDQGATTYLVIKGTQDVSGAPNFSSATFQTISVSSLLWVNPGNGWGIGIGSSAPFLPFVFAPSTYTGRIDLTNGGAPTVVLSLSSYIQKQRPSNTGFLAGINSGFSSIFRDESVDVAAGGFTISSVFNGVMITTNPPTGPLNFGAGSNAHVATFISQVAAMGDHPLVGNLSLNTQRSGNGNNALTEALRISMTDTATGGTVTNSFGINIDRPTLGGVAGSPVTYLKHGAIFIASQTATGANSIQVSTAFSILSDGRNDQAFFAGKMGVGFMANSSYTFAVSSSPDFYNVAVSSFGNLTFSGSSPTVTSCGASPAGSVIAATNNAGTIQVGGTVPTSCTINFRPPFRGGIPGNPSCTVSDNSVTLPAAVTSISNEALVVGFGAGGLAGGLLYYNCAGIRE